jgi:outer membrane protein TolC
VGDWNVFDRFATKEQTRRALAEKRRAEYDLRLAELDVQAEVVTLHNNLIEASERHRLGVQMVEQATLELRLAQEGLQAGLGTSLDVINAQVALAQARRDVVDAQTDYLKYRCQLVRATGGPLE